MKIFIYMRCNFKKLTTQSTVYGNGTPRPPKALSTSFNIFICKEDLKCIFAVHASGSEVML